MAAMDAEIDNIWHLNIFKEVPHPNGKNITMLKLVFCCKFEKY